MGNGTTTVGTPTMHMQGWLILIKCLYKGVIKLLSTRISQFSSKNGKLYRYPVQNMNTSAVTKLWSFRKILSFSILSTPNTSIIFDGKLLFNLNVLNIFNFPAYVCAIAKFRNDERKKKKIPFVIVTQIYSSCVVNQIEANIDTRGCCAQN